MSLPDSPVQTARQRQPVIERDAEPTNAEPRPEAKPESKTDTGTDFASRIGLTAGTPQDTLRFLGDLARNANLTGLPEAFGRFDIAFNGTDLSGLLNPRNRQNQRDQADRGGIPGERMAARLDRSALPTDRSAIPETDRLPPGVSKIERTRIFGTGSSRDTQVEIRYGMDGKPNFVRDHLGEWKSEDGGKTWKTGEPNLRVRRGEVSIDKDGNYSISNDDYGVKSKYSPDGKVTRTITNSGGEEFSVTRDKKGIVTGFSDKSGEWTGDGKNWTNSKTGEKKSGTAALTDFGEFRFKPDRGDAQIARTPQLERINKMQEELTREYGVKFARPGEKVKNEGRVPGEADEAPIYAGVPTEAELNTLKDVLKNTNHENYSGLKMWFIRPDENQNPDYGFYISQPGDKPATPHECNGCHNPKAVTDAKNGNMFVLPFARQEMKGFQGLEGTLYHELGHHEQRDKNLLGEMVGPGSTPESRKLAAEMGWKWHERTKQPVLEDKNGGLWKFDQDRKEFRWVAGKQPADGKRRLDQEQMRDRAKVPSINNYFDFPHEQHAESLAGFRLGVTGKDRAGGDRRTLAIDSPKMYEAIKKYDQAQIDRKYGPGPDGQPKMIRGLDGRIIENTPEARREVAAAEYRWKLEHLSEPHLPRIRDPERPRR